MSETELVKTWKVSVTHEGVVLKINGVAYNLGTSYDSVLFDLKRAQHVKSLCPQNVVYED